jgi:hypothetical protein
MKDAFSALGVTKASFSASPLESRVPVGYPEALVRKVA